VPGTTVPGTSVPGTRAAPRARKLSLSVVRSVRASAKGFVVNCSLPCSVVVKARGRTIAAGKGARTVRVRFTRAGLASARRGTPATVTARAGAQTATRAVTLRR
jgi:hypothetical protein